MGRWEHNNDFPGVIRGKRISRSAELTVSFSIRSLLYVVKADGVTVSKRIIGCVEFIIKSILQLISH